ncbi:MAG TPA: carbohydrate ABC transporter permease [Chloroflexia bacterium]|nr:carbohydrate ABC transporter permease [Chloroflexia bacterium]
MSTTISRTTASRERVPWTPARVRQAIGKAAIYLLVSALGVLFLVPLFWLVSSSLKEGSHIFDQPIEWWPATPQWHNYPDAWNALPFTRFFLNTMFVTLVPMVAEVFVSAIVAYGFSRFSFPGRNFLFMVMISTMFLPDAVKLIPTFLIWKQFNLINNYDPLVLGSVLGGTPLFIFLMRQFFSSVPKEIEEAALIDGANVFQTFTRVMIPLIRPALLSVSIISFQGHWNDFLSPLIYLNSQAKYTMTVGMYFFTGGTNERPHWEWLMAMSTLMIVPVLILFIFFQRYFIEGLTSGGVKG